MSKTDTTHRFQQNGDKSLYRISSVNYTEMTARVIMNMIVHDTRGGVYSHRLSYLEMESAKRRRLFYYGKSGNENYIEGI